MAKRKSKKVNADKAFELFRNTQMRIAKELGYDIDVVYNIAHSDSENEIYHIMRTARNSAPDYSVWS